MVGLRGHLEGSPQGCEEKSRGILLEVGVIGSSDWLGSCYFMGGQKYSEGIGEF